MQGNRREILTQWYLCGLKLVLVTKLIFFSFPFEENNRFGFRGLA